MGDPAGHGVSSKPECSYSPLAFAYDIKLLLDALQIDKAAIVGHSLGSIVAPGLGHNPFWAEPRAVADVIQCFLDAGASGSSPISAECARRRSASTSSERQQSK